MTLVGNDSEVRSLQRSVKQTSGVGYLIFTSLNLANDGM